PKDFPPYRIVYHHWRSLCDRQIMANLLYNLVKGKRAAMGKPHIQLIKADQGYRGVEGNMKELHPQLSLETVKSNFGTTDFLPLVGRWVVERTISWFTGTRRMMRNYEKYLHTATNMAVTCMVAFMLRYFR
ncbi:MAG: transposase, partial [Muribaculaceae bacterium]|nr:transposase [Muribaculaceae bacterium]